MRVLKSKRFWLASACILSALVVSYGIVEPRSPVGRSVFHIGYTPELTRPAFLHFYRWSLEEFEGSYLPAEVDAYLIKRLSSSFGKPEWTAIINFHLAQSSARWGAAASQADDALKKQIIAYLIPTLDAGHPSEALRTMEFIETLRRNDPLHKGGFASVDFYYQPDPRGPATLRRDQLVLAIDSFRRWWGDGAGWPHIKTTNPLEGTKIAIHYGP